MPDRSERGPFDVATLAEALDGAGFGVWRWSAATDRVTWAPRVEEIYGLSPGSFGGRYADFVARIHPDDRALVEAEIAAAIARRDGREAGSYFIEHRIVRGDGEVRWVECRGRVESDDAGGVRGMIGTIADTTVRRAREAEQRQRDEELRLFSELASDYVYVAEVDGDGLLPGKVVGALERVTGTTLEAIRARGGWMQIVHPDDRDALQRLIGELVRGRAVVNEYRIIDAGGEVRWLRDVVRPVRDASGAVVRIVGAVSDITDRRRLEAQLVQARKVEAIGRLAGAVAHDFNNLLTVVHTSLDLVWRQHPALRASPDLHTIREASRRAAELTRSLLAIGQRPAGQPRAIELGELIGAATPVLTRALGARHPLVVELADPALALRIDPGQAHLLLLNLAVNARDAMPAGGRFTIRGARRVFDERDPTRPPDLPPGDYVEIAAIDEGEGIDPAARPFLFEPFFTTKRNGNGLGLATCHGVARAAGGTIAVDRRPAGEGAATDADAGRRGACFRVYLPRIDAPGQPMAAAEVVSLPGGRETVLVVEDSTTLRALTSRILQSYGYTVLVADSAEAALATARERPIDLALVDIGLPDRSGVELAADLAALPSSVRVVLTSGNPGPALTEPLARALPFLPKPYDVVELAAIVRQVLDGASA